MRAGAPRPRPRTCLVRDRAVSLRHRRFKTFARADRNGLAVTNQEGDVVEHLVANLERARKHLGQNPGTQVTLEQPAVIPLRRKGEVVFKVGTFGNDFALAAKWD